MKWTIEVIYLITSGAINAYVIKIKIWRKLLGKNFQGSQFSNEQIAKNRASMQRKICQLLKTKQFKQITSRLDN